MGPSPESGADAKHYRLGTHRVVPPQVTLDRVRPYLLSMGITRVANITGLDRTGFPVVTVYRPNARSLSVSQGKGLDIESARVSGIMESVETYHGEHIHAPLRYGSVDELEQRLPLADVSRLPRSEARRYSRDSSMFWIEGLNWLDQSPLWLPLETVSVDYTLPLPPGSGSFAASSNGLASGNTRLEAISHGIGEVVERDAATLWKLRGAAQRSEQMIDPDSVDDPDCQVALARFADAGIGISIWDVTSDAGIAAFCCLAHGDSEDWADPEFGAGCHPAREVALLRALTEAAQARTTFIAGSRDDLGAALYRHTARRERREYCLDLLSGHEPNGDFMRTPTFASDAIADDVNWMLERLQTIGIGQVVVVDLTRAEFALPVVRVVIPGLEGPFGHEQGDFVPGPRARAVASLGA